MSGLFSSLRNAATALEVFSDALSVDQRNVANISTAGFAAQRVGIRTRASTEQGSADTVEIRSTGSRFADATVQAAASRASDSQTRARQLSPLSDLFDVTGSSGVLAALQDFSSAFARLSVSPNDASLGDLALAAAGRVASAFNTAAASIDRLQVQTDGAITEVTSRINSLTVRIRDFNVQANASAELDPATEAGLRASLDELSELVDITVNTNPNGTVAVLAGGQLPLVIGDQSYALRVNPGAAAGSQVTSSAGGNSPQSFSGSLGALLKTRTDSIGTVIGSGTSPGTLNTLAAGFASRVNALLASGVNAAGAAGTPLFTYDAGNLANAARTLSLDSLASPAGLGLADPGPPFQANGIANRLAALSSSAQPADQIAGFSAVGLFGYLAASVGRQLSDANEASASDQTSLTLAQTSRQKESGVSLDAEAIAITAFQRAYQANAQLVSVVDKLTLTAVNLIGPIAG